MYLQLHCYMISDFAACHIAFHVKVKELYGRIKHLMLVFCCCGLRLTVTYIQISETRRWHLKYSKSCLECVHKLIKEGDTVISPSTWNDLPLPLPL